MRVFVTGATGFIGRRLVERLSADGHEVTAMVRALGHECSGAAHCMAGRLEDEPTQLARLMRGCETVFHLAAKVSFDPSKLPELMAVNGEGTRCFLEAARLAHVQRVVVVSSACTVGLSAAADEILDESSTADAALEDRNPYLKSKRAAEKHCQDAANAGQQAIIVNPTTVFGPGDRTLNSGTLIRQVALGRFVPMPPGGSNVVDIDDVVDGILAAAQRGRSGERYILGGANLTFHEILSQIAKVVGRRPIFVPVKAGARLPMMAAAWLVGRITGSRLITPQIIGDTFAYKFYSSRRAEAELGWRAKRAFGDTLAAAWEYYVREGLIAAPEGVAA